MVGPGRYKWYQIQVPDLIASVCPLGLVVGVCLLGYNEDIVFAWERGVCHIPHRVGESS